MADSKELINIIMTEIRKNSGKNFESSVYKDEPIIKTAAQMANYLPPQYREMRKIARSHEAYSKSASWIFCRQGEFMKDFEDDFDYHGEFFCYYPNYNAMNDLQLRGYFAWRTKVRKGKIEPTSLSYAFVYIYELINLIGVNSPREGFDALLDFWTAYRSFDARLDNYVKRWLVDFAVYYGLDFSEISSLTDDLFEKSLIAFMDCRSCGQSELFDALCSLSSYNILNSRFYKENSEDTEMILCRVIVKLAEYYEKNRKITLFEKLFGKIIDGPYYMFSSAIFYENGRHPDCDVEINKINSYSCRNGSWRCKRFFGSRSKSRDLGAVVKAVDCEMRETYGFKSALKPEKTAKVLIGIIRKEINEFLEEKKRDAAPKIEIDMSKLQGIRTASEITGKKLIVDEETEEITAPDEPKPANNTELSDDEFAFMQKMLYGEDYESFLHKKGIMLSVIVDCVNEKLFDLFGDTVIDFNGDVPELIEDYIEELKGIIGK